MEPLPGEKACIERFLAGDVASFARIMRHYEPYVLGLLWRITGDRSSAEDLCQETFLKVLKGLPSFRMDSSLKTWIFRVAHNTATDHLRASKPDAGSLDEEALPASEASSGPLHHVLDRQMQEAVERAMKNLSRDQRVVLHMLYWDEMTVAEIASALHMPEGTVKTLLFRGRQALRRCVGAHLSEGVA
jgi:RNA polymerase sigma-70 factor (ECF subfamily)